MQKLNNSEIKVTEVISFILGQFRDERVDHDLEVTSELILIARILHQRFKINNGIKVPFVINKTDLADVGTYLEETLLEKVSKSFTDFFPCFLIMYSR